MPIKIKHAPSAAAIGESAYTIGKGQKMRWATDIALKQQALGLQAASVGASARARAGQLALGYEQLESRERQQQAELEFRKQQQEDEMGLQLQARLKAQEDFRIKNTIYEYTPSQLKELDRLDNCQAALEKAFAKGEWNLEGIQEGTRQINHLKNNILPQGRLNFEMTPKQLHDSQIFTDDITGERVYVNPNNGQRIPLGESDKDYNKDYNDTFKILAAAATASGDELPTPNEINKYINDREMGRAQYKALAAQTKLEKEKRQASWRADAQDEAEQEAITEQAEMDRDVASLPRLFSDFVEDPKIGRKVSRRKGLSLGAKVYGKGLLLGDKVYGEEAFNEILLKTTALYPDIPPDVIKAELKKWWLAKYEAEEGQDYQKFQNPEEFKGAVQESAPITAINPKTGELIMSSDGGKTWQKIQ